MIVVLEGLENVNPEDGLEIPVGFIRMGPGELDIPSLTLDSECYFEDQGGYSLSLREEAGSPGELGILITFEDTQCAVATTASQLLRCITVDAIL